ncbi:MAG TPA: LLM class flavin-dependent oxidoreductase [Actinomycetota bacterium]|nr:LLM class flavin-dependent oxidoreductase [Actinomycetota bacterium]
MRFGYGLITCQRYPGDARTDADLYREALDLAAFAEEVGFDSVWTSEHHFWDDAYAPSLLPLCAAIPARTSRVTIGTGLLLAPMHHPIRLAEDAAVVDLISDGRFVLGLGHGWIPWELEAFGASMGDRPQRTETAIATCRRAWAGEEIDGVRVTPLPARPGGPPIWVGAIREPAVRRAARMADGWLGNHPGPDGLRTAVGWLRDELESIERPPGEVEVAGYWPVFVDEDPGLAWATVRDHHRYVEWKYDAAERKARGGPPPAPPPTAPDDEAELRRAIICGTPDEVARSIVELAAAAGPELHFVARLYWPGMGADAMRAAARLFAERVIPAVRAEVE